jgi:alkylation response protein AidB-like acyl-CoA dehydrogenase
MGLSTAVIPDPTASIRAFEAVAALAARRAQSLDENGEPPLTELEALADAGLLSLPFSPALGGAGLASGQTAARTLAPALRILGRGSLPLGRLYEGHVNAIRLVEAYGSVEQRSRMADEARRGALFGVWAADENEKGLRIRPSPGAPILDGRKIYCSGAGQVLRAVVTGKDEANQTRMFIPRLAQGERFDLSEWTAQGMRASLTGTVLFTGLEIRREEMLGEPGDYHREPDFSGGAWRFAAVQVGGMEALLIGLRDHLLRADRGGDPYQSARLGESAIAVETARLWVERAAELFELRQLDAAALVAYVNLARTAVERAALDLLERVHRSVGLRAFLRPNSIERFSRDLATYLRQPGPDRALGKGAEWVLSEGGAVFATRE